MIKLKYNMEDNRTHNYSIIQYYMILDCILLCLRLYFSQDDYIKENKLCLQQYNNPVPSQKMLPQNPNSQTQLYPTDTIFRLDNTYTSKSGYIEIHDLNFELTEITYGSNEVRKNYNITKELKRYFAKRYFYFSLFDQGIQLDQESWYSVVAEPISKYLCERFVLSGVKSVFEAFCGVGGIAVQAAGVFQQLTVNDICQNKIKMLKNNLGVYAKGLNQLTILNKDYAQIKPFKVDAVIICPPWGGIDVSQYSHRDLDQIMKPKLSDILTHCKKFSNNLMLQMPKTTNIQNLLKIINLCFLNPIIKIQKINVDGRLSQIFVYIGDINFTGFNCHVYRQILKDTKKQIKNIKQMKKDLKKKIKEGKYQIFQEIYMQNNVNNFKHFFIQ